MRTVPRAAASATAEPDTSEKNMLERVVVMASPPRTNPTRLAAKSTRRFEIPAWFISAPAKMKRGTATMGKLSVPLNRRRGTTTRGVPVVSAMTAMLAAMST
jgi:hypothetical protein